MFQVSLNILPGDDGLSGKNSFSDKVSADSLLKGECNFPLLFPLLNLL